MREQVYGRVVNTTSAAGLFGNFGQTNYGAAKMGLVGFTKALAQEGRKRNVLANVIAPGARTRMTEELLGPMADALDRSEEHTSELQSLMRISYAVFCLQKKNQ